MTTAPHVDLDGVGAALLEANRAIARLIDDEAARHEAAHAIATWQLGGIVDRVTIEPSPPESQGRTFLGTRLSPDATAVVALAGGLAGGVNSGSTASDDALALDLVGEAGLEAARDRARWRVEDHSAAIAVVAAALIIRRTIDRSELEEIRASIICDRISAAA